MSTTAEKFYNGPLVLAFVHADADRPYSAAVATDRDSLPYKLVREEHGLLYRSLGELVLGIVATCKELGITPPDAEIMTDDLQIALARWRLRLFR